jgi:DNA mismatch repair ATPase MutS
LLPTNKCIRNDVELNQLERFWILSGSNMAGKSTLLRTVGMNAVLAYAGAPVRASQAHMSHFTLGASISLSDSLLDGKSKFLAEAERLQHILQQTGAGRPVLFLIDEILSGTNSHDRRIACEHIVKALIAGGAMGILSTHDLALTEIARATSSNGTNRCMESNDPDQPLKFDYVVKPGVTRNSSATAILKLLGIPVRFG